ncbi:hypothetical protein FNV43_RR25545 [Rhamnella rubrinervis]|uniref:Uncharacterized protein n=1 Tax=Rhamnella rubrinervis TaxID=2594499 RepID=A0A8K0GMA3_9ROSA|nr:hypothetical protein FNV43_RR25545 [Rhamnella rubrinervis]
MTFSSPLAAAASSTSSSSFLHLLKLTTSSSFPLLFHPNSYSNRSVSESPMDKHKNPQGKEDEMDQLREAYSKGANEISTKGLSDDIIPHLLHLYGCCATPRDFEIYAPHASFEDPLMCAHGVKQIKSAFYSLSKVFSESKIVEYSVKENSTSPGSGEILIDNKQHYKFLGKDIDMISLIKLYVEEGKVVRHEDWWDKKPLKNRETVNLPLVGRILEMTRRGSMLATHAMMRFGKDPTV